MNKSSHLSASLLTMLAVSFAAGCERVGKDDATSDTDTAKAIPSVLSSTPEDGATDVARNAFVGVTFDRPMDESSLLAGTLTITTGDPPVPVAGRIMYGDDTAQFWPTALLAVDTEYVATVTTEALSVDGLGLDADHVWRFSTGSRLDVGVPVELGRSGGFSILAKAGVAVVPTSSVTGHIGVSPAAGSYVTGLSLTADASNTFSTSDQVTGRVYAADDAAPTPAELTGAVSSMELALTTAGGRAPDVTELGAGNVGGMTLRGGVYKWSTGLLIPTDVTLHGSAQDVWIFQIAQNLTMSSGARVALTGGALPHNVFWIVEGAVDLGTTAHLEGVVLAQTAITLRTGATVTGRLLAQTAVNIDGAVVTEPTP